MLGIVTDRKVIKAATTASGAKALKDFANKWGMKEYVVAGNLFDWFGQQDDIFQREVAGLLKDLEIGAAEAFMKRMAERRQKSIDAQIGEGSSASAAESPSRRRR